MRQLLIEVPRGRGQAVMDKAKAHRGTNLASFPADGAEGPVDVVMANVDNARVEGLMDDLESVPELHVTLTPRGVIALHPPASQAPEQVTSVSPRSPIEVFLDGLQSVGSWKGFLGYAAVAGVVVWIGLFTNTIYLLTAAMLIAPFAGPAMTLALATARGDPTLLGRSAGRYAASIAVTIAVTFLLSMIMRQEVVTQQMLSTSLLSSVAVLLPLTAGAAGALNLCQSERSSLVTGAATGVLVAASLAPPAGMIGMAAALSEWQMVKAGAFVLLLQLVGINLSGAVVFRLYGLTPKGARYDRGRGGVSAAAWGASVVAAAGLLTWQFWGGPQLQHSSHAQRARAEIREVVQASGLARVVELEARYTRADIPGPPALLIEAYVQRVGGAAATDPQLKQSLSRQIRERLRSAGFNATPLLDITVLND